MRFVNLVAFVKYAFLTKKGNAKIEHLLKTLHGLHCTKICPLEKMLKTNSGDTYSLPYSHAKKPIFRPMTVSVSKRNVRIGFPKGV